MEREETAASARALPLDRASRLVATIALMLASAMQAADATIANVALPQRSMAPHFWPKPLPSVWRSVAKKTVWGAGDAPRPHTERTGSLRKASEKVQAVSTNAKPIAIIRHAAPARIVDCPKLL